MLQKRIARVGLAKQTAGKGTAATEATYDVGLLSGTVVSADVAESDLNPTATSRVLSYVERTGIMPGAGFQVVAMPRSIGLLLLAVCGRVFTTAGTPNSHEFSVADDLPYLTVFGRYDDQYLRVVDAKVNQLVLSFDNAGSLKAEATLMGCDLKFDSAVAYTIATGGGEDPVGSPPLIGAGGEFSIDGATAKVKSGRLTISNAASQRMLATGIAPDDVDVGMQEVTFSLTVIPTDLTTWRKRITGAAGGTTLSGDPFKGAASMKWVRGADKDLTFSAGTCVIATDMPDVDPAGGPAEVTVEGRVLISAAVVNEVQDVVVAAAVTAGTFTLDFDGQVTAAIAFDATDAAVQTALEALSNIAAGDVAVTGGIVNDATGVQVEFRGALAGTNVPALVADGTNLTGGGVTVTTVTPGVAPYTLVLRNVEAGY